MPPQHNPHQTQFLGLQHPHTDPKQANAIILVAPYEHTSTFGHGSANGPAAILEASQEVELFDAELNLEPYKLTQGISTQAPISLANCTGQEMVQRVANNVTQWIQAGKFVVTLGGEHTAALGPLKAHLDHYKDLTILQIDAHSDLRHQYHGSPYNHACVMARVLEWNGHPVQVGIRSQAQEERQIAEANAIPVWHAHEIHAAPNNTQWITQVIAACKKNVYLTFDCDALDPAIIPATGTPEPGGLTWTQVNALLKTLCNQRTLVGFDITELAPIPNLHHPQFTIAKLIYRILGLRFAT